MAATTTLVTFTHTGVEKYENYQEYHYFHPGCLNSDAIKNIQGAGGTLRELPADTSFCEECFGPLSATPQPVAAQSWLQSIGVK